ncbi:hypothetical protein F5879DRAFT_62777 [Lentinula edodes]|nr:hypothetical protein F5879DRAFT_62777 [Lentinula edodes]
MFSGSSRPCTIGDVDLKIRLLCPFTSVSAAASTLRSLDRKYKIFLETMHSTIGSLERQYVGLLRSNSLNHTGCHISLLHANIVGLNSTIQILSIEISTAKLFEPLVNLSIILPDTNETCQLLSNAFHDLSTQITQVAQRINSKLLDALACDHRGSSLEIKVEQYLCEFAPLFVQTAEVEDILRKLKHQMMVTETILRFGGRNRT